MFKFGKVWPKVKGMKILDKTLFLTTIVAPCVHVDTQKFCFEKIACYLQPYYLKLRCFKNTRSISDHMKQILLDPDLCDSTKIAKLLHENGYLSDGLQIDSREIEISYDNWSLDDILNAVLPDGQSFSSFSLIGHIAHLNLKEPLLPFKNVIGKDVLKARRVIKADVLLDKVPKCTTVVNKMDIIEDEFRNLRFEHLSGVMEYVTRVRENGCTYELDFSQVFWNPRLGTEHQRLVNCFQRGDCVFDVFAGVGPFVIPAAKKRCRVYANDLNPKCIHWLQKNCRMNKVKIEMYNEDGSEFLKAYCSHELAKLCRENFPGKCHFIMNLPATAVTFLPYFIGLMDNSEIGSVKHFPHVYVHCYTFSKDENSSADAQKQVQEAFKEWEITNTALHCVRNFCSSFSHMSVNMKNKAALNNGEIICIF
ncbi:tRNA (guanine-N(1)-)-methyltransferase [Trichinella spiralis]|uniref:tRNA (guanine(37)-N1)-methyltransferase n=1 Tax=Trichinella spiralis TaxID=6334 RepID=E5SFE5_TRISP|nr:tRNA (guanine-N(1)-)-methyltransferase [Trichinella spiralis]KRY40731.1 tRNA (guanine(37)-N1)-methyltransferase [Trichinella spiralis]